MASRVIKTQQDLEFLFRFLSERKLPFTVSVADGAKRSVEQNRLQRLWIGEIAEQLGDQTREEVRGLCKLQVGVPILREENEEFRRQYDEVFRPLPYETKVSLMQEPMDFPVTRIMTSKQKTRYLNDLHRYWASKGIYLTDPEGRFEQARNVA